MELFIEKTCNETLQKIIANLGHIILYFARYILLAFMQENYWMDEL